MVNFGGSVHIAQNFTNDTERLKKVVSGVKFSAVSPNGDAGGTALSRAESDFGARTVLLGLRSLAKSLATVPGRKTLIFLSAGFKLDSELRSELTAVVDTCNKSNVAIYPIDVRGLVTGAPGAQGFNRNRGDLQAVLVNAVYVPGQHGGGSTGGGTTGGSGGTHGGTGSSGGGTGGGKNGTGNTGSGNTGGVKAGGGGTRSPAGGATTTQGITNPLNQSRSIVPHMPDINTQQDVLFALAQGTGGFVIVNTNDLLGGLDRIANEQNEYYVLGYSPAGGDDDEGDGACHELKVKLDRGGANVRSRTGYCDTKPVDLLAGSAKGKDLESRAAGSQQVM